MMNNAEKNAKAHEIATRAGSAIVKEGMEAGLAWTDILIACETTIAIVALACAKMESTPDKVRWATEMIDTMSERAHSRVMDQLK